MCEAEQLGRVALEIGERLDNLELKFLAAHRLAEVASKRQHFDEALEWMEIKLKNGQESQAGHED
jgi:hypothetical protein